MRYIFLLLSALLAGCAKPHPDDTLPGASDYMLRQEIARRGWHLDEPRAAREKTHLASGLSGPIALTQDEVLAQGKAAWGIPPRLAGKSLRYEAERNPLALNPAYSIRYLDAIGRAGELSGVPPKELLDLYWKRRAQFRALGLSLRESVALTAGIAIALKKPDGLEEALSKSLGTLQDPKWNALLGRTGIDLIEGERDAIDLLADMDRLQSLHHRGEARRRYLANELGGEWNAMLHPDALSTICMLVGEMRCAAGITRREIEARQRAPEIDDAPYMMTSAGVEAAGKALGR